MEYLSGKLHVDIKRNRYDGEKSLPLYLSGAFSLEMARIEDFEFLIIIPKARMPLSALRKQYAQIRKLTGINCLLQLDVLSRYGEEKLAAENIAFFVQGGTVYIPFLGMFFAKTPARPIRQVEEISFITQKMLLLAFYEKWDRIRMSEVAARMRVSQMTATRQFDEIEGLGLPFIVRDGKSRFFTNSYSSAEYLDAIMPLFRDPVKKIYRLAAIPKKAEMRLGSISALSHYSMLSDDKVPTFALTQATARAIALPSAAQTNFEDDPACLVEVHGYIVDYGDKKAIDPISAFLSLSDTDRDDPRVEGAFDEIEENLL